MIWDDEEWRPVIGFSNYLVSNHGRVYNTATDRIIQPGGRTQWGYIQYHLRKNRKRYPCYIHRLVAEAFIDPHIEGLEVDHLDDDNTNNCVWNLEIVTPKVNSQRIYSRNRRVPPRMIPVRIVETNEEFVSVSDCARALNRTLSSVLFALRNGTPTAGLHIEEVMP